MRLKFLLPIVLCLCLTACAFGQSTLSGFGRFGRFNDDGLLTFNVTPSSLTLPPTVRSPLCIVWSDEPVQAVVQRITPTEKVLKLSGGGLNAPVAARYSLLYPGLSVTFASKEARLRITDAGGRPVAFRLFSGSDNALTRSVAIYPASGSGVPIQIICPRAQKPRFAQGDGLILKADSPLGEVRFVTPLGLKDDLPLHSPQTQEQMTRAMRFWETVPLPTLAASDARLAPDGKSALFTDTYRAQSGRLLAPIPPVLAFALTRGYPAKVEGKLTTLDCRTKWGPYAFVAGRVVRYTLPIPPTAERGYVKVTDSPPNRVALLNDLVGHLGGDWVKNGVDLGYAGMTNAQMAWPYLSAQKRREVLAAWKTYLPLTFRFPPYPASDKRQTWKVETEPFTRQAYVWTYFINGPGQRRYDIEWGNALPLYGMYKYAQFTGDWAFVRRYWSAVPRIYRYLDIADDWAWMTVVNADHGYSTGTGDPMAAAFCGTVACLKMARALGDKKAEQRYAIRAARMAVPTVARLWMTEWARHHNFIGPKSVVLGFHETEGYTRARVQDDDPWDVTSLLSGDGVLPELYNAFLAFGRDGLARFEQLYAQGFPNWYKADHRYPFNTTYKGNSVYVTFPHIYARAVLGEPTATLWQYVDAAESNRNNAWIGPNVIAELLSREAPLLLTEWQPAAYLDSEVAADGSRAMLEFQFAAPTAWTLTAALRAGFTPETVQINGKSVPFTVRIGQLTVRASTQGTVRVDIFFRR